MRAYIEEGRSAEGDIIDGGSAITNEVVKFNDLFSRGYFSSDARFKDPVHNNNRIAYFDSNALQTSLHIANPEKLMGIKIKRPEGHYYDFSGYISDNMSADDKESLVFLAGRINSLLKNYSKDICIAILETIPEPSDD